VGAETRVGFHRRVRAALADEQLRRSLDNVSSRFIALRAEALASLPDAEAVRDRARWIRARTLARLDEHLERFAVALEGAGGRAHWARDAGEATAVVLEIARERGVRSVVKSKSMISEEVGLNHALEAAGVSVVESDLGEYIIQLAGEAPSHIIVPAIHKNRRQIGRLFEEKISLPATDDPARMTAAARDRLRGVFLSADMGISGVNFGVAETGSIAIVSNEGNASLTMAAPRVHVAMMGIERLVPSLADLAVMLQVLARSATGQRLTVYTDLVTGPRREGDPDGPGELHVVLVDNGRARILGTEEAEILYCIRCGACLNACPVYREIGGHAYGSVYPGPVGAVLTPALQGLAGWSDLPEASSLCGACREVCPVRIDIPRLLLHQREEAARARVRPAWHRWSSRLYRAVAVRPALFRVAVWGAGVATRLLGPWGLRHLPGPTAAWTRHREFPVFARRAFSAEWRLRGGGRP
jgi:L-lactate dehydrogenase complex protein LldF